MAFKDLRKQYGEKISELLPKFRLPSEVNVRDLEELERRGTSASHLLENDAFKRLVKDVEGRYLNLWRTSSGDQTELRERAHIGVNLLDDLVNTLRADVAKGDAAAAALRKLTQQ